MTLWRAAAVAGIAALTLTIAHAVTPVPGAAACVEDQARRMQENR